MSKYLTKLVSNPSYDSSLDVKYSILSFMCGDGYKNGTKHKFESKDITDVSLIINVIRRFRLGTIITEITKNSFVFENTNEKLQIFCFRLCRFVRNPNIKKILENTILINKSGVVIQNAFILANYHSFLKNSIECNINYYDNSRDIITHDNSRIHKPYKTLKECIEVIKTPKTYFSSIFKSSTSEMKNEKIKLFKFLNKQEFKKAERYLLKVYK